MIVTVPLPLQLTLPPFLLKPTRESRLPEYRIDTELYFFPTVHSYPAAEYLGKLCFAIPSARLSEMTLRYASNHER